MPESGRGVVLGIDFGRRRIGMATGNTLTGTARALATVTGGDGAIERVARVLGEWRPDRVVIGLPLGPDGSESDMSREVRAFAEQLQTACPEARLEFHDERYSSRSAEARFAEARAAGRARRRDARGLDGIAAALIVESWLADNGRAGA